MKKRRMAWVLISLAAVVLAWVFISLPPHLGVRDGRLAPCPPSPNCVCSQDSDPEHAIDPLTFKGSGMDAFRRLAAIIAAEPRTRILDHRDGYLRVEFTTRICRYRDDVEFLLEEPRKVIQVRSASRLGYGDLGVNRDRVERLRQLFNAAQKEN